jgi:hypothetical protein
MMSTREQEMPHQSIIIETVTLQISKRVTTRPLPGVGLPATFWKNSSNHGREKPEPLVLGGIQ